MSSQQQGQAWDAFWRLERIWKSNLPIAIKVRLYKCTVLSVLLYESETWTLTESLCEISTFSNLTTFGFCWASVAVTMSLRSPYMSQTQARPLSTEVKGQQLRFLGQSLRRDVCTICRETKCWRAEAFVSAMHLKGHYGRLHSTEGAKMRYSTEDRDNWRHRVAACLDNPD